MMKIEILYFEGCPNHGPAVERVRETLEAEGLTAEVVEVNVANEAIARSLSFLGSPTIRVNGIDVEALTPAPEEFGMACRTYTEGGIREGLPSRALIRKALREAVKGASAPHDCCKVPPTSSAPEPSGMNRKGLLLGASVAAAIGASLCCILPIVAAATGLGALAASVTFERWRPYLLSAAGLLLAGGFLAYRDHRKACAPGSVCATKPMSRWNFIALGIVTLLVIGLATFPY